MRTRTDDDSSLELLLDTMCNTFGGIVFIAMLIAILLRNTNVVTKDKGNKERRQEINRQELANQIASLDSDLSELSALSATYDASIDRIRKHPKLPLFNEIKKANAELADREQQIKMLQKQLADESTESSHQEKSARGHKNAISQMESEINKLQSQVKSEEAKRKRRFRLPQMRGTVRTPIFVIVRNARFYFITNIQDGRMSTYSPWDTEHVTYTRQGDSFLFTPKSGGGFSLTTRAEARAALASVSGEVTRRDYFLDFLVYNDSFEEFVHLKEEVNALHLSYNWVPLTPDIPSGVRLVSGAVSHEVQ